MEKHGKQRALIAALVVVLLLAAGAAYTWPRMEISGLSAV